MLDLRPRHEFVGVSLDVAARAGSANMAPP